MPTPIPRGDALEVWAYDDLSWALLPMECVLVNPDQSVWRIVVTDFTVTVERVLITWSDGSASVQELGQPYTAAPGQTITVVIKRTWTRVGSQTGSGTITFPFTFPFTIKAKP